MSPALLAAVGGALAGSGVWVLLLLRFNTPSLEERLADPAPAPRRAPQTAQPGGWASRVGAFGAPVLSALGLPSARTRHQLRIVERDSAGYLSEKVTAVAAGVVLPLVVGAMFAFAGITLADPVALGMWLLLAIAGWLVPDMALRSEAEKRRAEMRHALGGWIDLVVVALAGGAGVQGALHEASESGPSPALRRVRHALRAAAVRREPPWTALRDLAERYDLEEAGEVAASLELAGADGARVRTSLAAKAKALRATHLAHLDAEAQSATERMSLPVVILFAGFLILIGYPALSLILTTL